MIMPSNWVFSVPDHMAMWLLNAIPEKVNLVLNDLISEKSIRSKIKRKPLLQTLLTKLEKFGSSRFGKSLKINDKCNSCKWCVNNCPTKNIEINMGKPYFLDKCIMCFRCIYGCPQ